MKVKLKHDVEHHARWVPNRPKYKKGSIVPVVWASNQPDWKKEGKCFIDTLELKGDPYGILIDKSDYDPIA